MGKAIACLFIGFLLGATFACVADPTFPYNFYTLFSPDYNGILQGPSSAQDLSLEVCRPTPKDKAPCTVLLTDTFLVMRDNDLKYQSNLNYCKRDLKNCQAACGSQ